MKIVEANQILGLSELNAKIDAQKDPTIVKPRFKRGNIRETYHEVLQRIDSETDVYNHYQQHWFSASLEVSAKIITEIWYSINLLECIIP